MERPKFNSVFEGIREFFRVSRALTGLLRTGYKLPSSFREQICLSVTYTNDCGA